MYKMSSNFYKLYIFIFHLSRVACQKQNLPKLFNEPNLDIQNQTEKQIMEAHGYARVWNSGLIKWEWDNKIVNK